jgi:phage FluMu protein Com
MEKRCPRCNQIVKELDSVKIVCNRCRDVMEFGYPSFAAYQLEGDQEPTERMEISEGWTLPTYFTVRKN